MQSKLNRTSHNPPVITPSSPQPLTSQELEAAWQAGAILHVCNLDSFLSYYIRKSLTKLQRWELERNGIASDGVQCYGSHDAICVMIAGCRGFGEMLAEKGRGVWTPIEEYQKKIDEKRAIVWLLYPTEATRQQGIHASLHWFNYGQDKPYDYRGIFFLWLKCLLHRFPLMRHWEFAYWCTENVAKLWKLEGFDVFRKKYPTPLTTEHRCGMNWSKTKEITLDFVRP